MAADNSSASPANLPPPRLRFVPCGSRRRRISYTEEEDSRPTIDILPDDLLLEILIRLPSPRAASRCKSVSKGWRSLISSPGFNRRFVSHHQRTSQRPPLLIYLDDRQWIIRSFLPLPSTCHRTFEVFHKTLEVLDSYKDLVLCGFGHLGGIGYWYDELDRSYFICNPFTKQWVALPLAPELPREHSLVAYRLVCEPRISNNLDLGDGQFFVHSEYRFRVVLVYRNLKERSFKLDVFCSNTGKWTKELLALHNYWPLTTTNNVVSCNAEVFWLYGVPGDRGWLKHLIAAFNPFRPDISPTAIDPPPVFGTVALDISVSQGALHAIVLQQIVEPGRPPRIAPSVWRLQEDRKSWRKVSEALMKIPSSYGSFSSIQPRLHPGKPEVILFDHNIGQYYLFAPTSYVKWGEVLSCNLETGGELELFSDLRDYQTKWNLFPAEFSCWPTPIPRYEKLRVMYDGSYSCWVQSNDE